MSEENPTDDRRTDEEALPNRVWDLYSSRIIVSMAAFFVATGTIVYRVLEDWSWVDSFYFTIITLTTVGYGDLAPSSPGTKLFTAFFIVTGISLLGAALNEILKRRGRRFAARRARHRSDR